MWTVSFFLTIQFTGQVECPRADRNNRKLYNGKIQTVKDAKPAPMENFKIYSIEMNLDIDRLRSLRRNGLWSSSCKLPSRFYFFLVKIHLKSPIQVSSLSQNQSWKMIWLHLFDFNHIGDGCKKCFRFHVVSRICFAFAAVSIRKHGKSGYRGRNERMHDELYQPHTRVMKKFTRHWELSHKLMKNYSACEAIRREFLRNEWRIILVASPESNRCVNESDRDWYFHC